MSASSEFGPPREVAIVRGTSGRGPGWDPESALIAAALALGFTLASDGLADVVEQLPDGTVSRQTTWAIWADRPVRIEGEEVSWAEFVRRWQDEAWLMANRHSVIGRLHWATTGLHWWHQEAFRRVPGTLVRNGMLFALIPPGASDEQAAAMVRELHGVR